MKIKEIKLSFILNLIIILSVFFCTTALAAKPLRVLIIPFNIHSEKDLSFLKKGVEDMLASRLAYEDKVIPLSKEEIRRTFNDLPETISKQAAVSLGEKLQADYVVFGSLTVFGDSISTDARFVDVQKQKSVIVFNQFGKDHGDVILHINIFSQQINEKVFGRKTISSQPPLPAPEKKTEDSIRKHPETLWTPENKTGIYSYGTPTAQGKESFSVWKSRRFKSKINGIAIGDVDGDGRNETVFISAKTVHIYRYSDGRFAKVAEIKGKGDIPYIGVDVADINNNEKAEIFVTKFIKTSKKLDSFVLELSGPEFKNIQDNSNWYYRVLNISGRGEKVLLGQKWGAEDIFSRSGIYELKWENGRYEPAQRQILPKNINIYGFTYGDVLNNGQEMIVAFTESDYLQILDQNGNEEWKSIERYGGSPAFLDKPPAMGPESKEEMDRVYLKQRIHVADLDKDGKNEIFVVNNQDLANRLFSRLRVFKSGHIECLVWDNLGLYPKWKTRKISGYISDYTIADIDNDGQDELVFSMVSKTGIGSVLGEAKSYLVSQEISK